MMRVAKRLIAWLAFTRTEQNVLFFLVGALVLGSGIRLFHSGATPWLPDPDARTDSVFAALTALDLGEGEGDLPPPVDINTASKAELVALPGIGEVTAERIILYREEVGPFTSIDELLQVKGISKKKLEQLHALITIQ